jgi:hypothetical protein
MIPSIEDRSEASLARKGAGKEAKLSYCGNLLVENRKRIDRGRRSVSGQRHRPSAMPALVMLEKIPGQRLTGGRRQRVRPPGFC